MRGRGGRRRAPHEGPAQCWFRSGRSPPPRRLPQLPHTSTEPTRTGRPARTGPRARTAPRSRTTPAPQGSGAVAPRGPQDGSRRASERCAAGTLPAAQERDYRELWLDARPCAVSASGAGDYLTPGDYPTRGGGWSGRARLHLLRGPRSGYPDCRRVAGGRTERRAAAPGACPGQAAGPLGRRERNPDEVVGGRLAHAVNPLRHHAASFCSEITLSIWRHGGEAKGRCVGVPVSRHTDTCSSQFNCLSTYNFATSSPAGALSIFAKIIDISVCSSGKLPH